MTGTLKHHDPLRAPEGNFHRRSGTPKFPLSAQAEWISVDHSPSLAADAIGWISKNGHSWRRNVSYPAAKQDWISAITSGVVIHNGLEIRQESELGVGIPA